MAAWTPEELQRTMHSVTKKAVAESRFRQLVLADPYAAIQSVTGKAAPEGLTLQMINATSSSDLTFVLLPIQDDALSDEDLEQVVGGVSDFGGFVWGEYGDLL